MKFTSLAQLNYFLRQPKMDYHTEQEAINGLIAQYVDVCFVQGNGFIASQLKPRIQAVFRKIGPDYQCLIEPMAIELISYGHTPIEVRRRSISQSLMSKVGQMQGWALRQWLVYTTKACYPLGITETEMERLLIQHLERELSTITLEELFNRGLSPASVAGADRRLKAILDKRIKDKDTLPGKILYEHDIKTTLWELSMNGHYLIPEASKILQSEGTIDKQADLLMRIMKRQEPGLIRKLLIRILRKTIAGLPDIHQDVKQLDTQNIELPLPENADAIETKPLWPQSSELSKIEGKEAIIEEFASKGVNYNDLTPNEWEEIFERYELIHQGYEFSSKTGVSISSFYGNSADVTHVILLVYKPVIGNITSI